MDFLVVLMKETFSLATAVVIGGAGKMVQLLMMSLCQSIDLLVGLISQKFVTLDGNSYADLWLQSGWCCGNNLWKFSASY
jgi:hypothetical protein